VIGVVAFGATASAAKQPNPPATVDCGAAGSFQVTSSPGNGNFTPAKIIGDGGGVLIPVAFSNQSGTFTDPDGNVSTETEPDVSHPAPANKDLMSCHFTIAFSDPSGGSVSFSGDVVAFRVPPQR
jgi:hypothetical protein